MCWCFSSCAACPYISVRVCPESGWGSRPWRRLPGTPHQTPTPTFLPSTCPPWPWTISWLTMRGGAVRRSVGLTWAPWRWTALTMPKQGCAVPSATIVQTTCHGVSQPCAWLTVATWPVRPGCAALLRGLGGTGWTRLVSSQGPRTGPSGAQASGTPVQLKSAFITSSVFMQLPSMCLVQ